MKFIVLGAAAGGGLPQWNCGCANCCDARRGVIPFASQSSLAVSVNDTDWAVLNASPDIRTQLQTTPALHPTALRHSPISSVLLTNGDIDHVAGLLSLREQTPFDLYATGDIHKVLTQNSIFEAVNRNVVSRHQIALETRFDVLPSLETTVFPVPGKVPLYLEGAEVQTDMMGEQTVGVRLSDGKRVAYYIPGCAMVTDALLSQISDADILFFDGTLWDDDEMIRTGTGVKTGRRMGHIPISGEDGSIAMLNSLSCRKVYIHMNNTNPVWQPSSKERAFVEENGWVVPVDGLEIML